MVALEREHQKEAVDEDECAWALAHVTEPGASTLTSHASIPTR